MKTATYIGGEFDNQFDQACAIILSKGQPLTVNDEEIETANLLVYDSVGTPHIKFNVPHESDKIKSKNEKEETHHPYFVSDIEVIEKMTKSSGEKVDTSELENEISDLKKSVESILKQLSDQASKTAVQG